MRYSIFFQWDALVDFMTNVFVLVKSLQVSLASKCLGG